MSRNNTKVAGMIVVPEPLKCGSILQNCLRIGSLLTQTPPHKLKRLIKRIKAMEPLKVAGIQEVV
jgi:hypothetical protein